jgi:predicted DCC family thiol-disulfide oxidoreductase YuxK
MRFQLSIVYTYAGLAKLNAEFLDGRVLDHYFADSLLPIPAFDQPMLAAISVSAVAAELLMGLGVWLPRLRPAVFAVAIPLHLGMIPIAPTPLLAAEIGVFALLMFTLLGAFVDIEERARLVVWDDTCTLCRRWVAAFRALDAFGALRLVGASAAEAYAGTNVTREAASLALQLVEPDGTVRQGYSAVRGIVAVLPFGFLIAPWMGLPGIRTLGDRTYVAVATRRTCSLGNRPAAA